LHSVLAAWHHLREKDLKVWQCVKCEILVKPDKHLWRLIRRSGLRRISQGPRIQSNAMAQINKWLWHIENHFAPRLDLKVKICKGGFVTPLLKGKPHLRIDKNRIRIGQMQRLRMILGRW